MQDLISRVYDCALQPDQWPDVLQDIARRSGAFGAMVFDCERRGNSPSVVLRYSSSIYDPDLVGWYVQTFNQHEIADQARFAQLSSPGDEVNLIRCDDLYASRAELEAKENMQAMMNFGVYHRAGALLSKDTDAMDRFALQFSKEQGAITEPARQQVLALLPHVAKSLSIGRAFRQQAAEKAMFFQALEAMPLGVAIVRANGDLIYCNVCFNNLASDYDLLIPRRPNSIRLSKLPLAMQSLLAQANNHGQFGARPLREAGFMPGKHAAQGLFIEACPITRHRGLEDFGADTFLMSLLDSARANSVDPEVIRRFMPLSNSEISILDMVLRGLTNGEIADARGRSLETVNTQMKALIRKSGTRNRTELVRVAVGLSLSSLKTGA